MVYSFNFFIGNESFDCLANTFRIKTSNGKPLFLTNEKKIVIHSECLKVTGNEGTIFDGSIQAPSINGDNTVHNLKYLIHFILKHYKLFITFVAD